MRMHPPAPLAALAGVALPAACTCLRGPVFGHGPTVVSVPAPAAGPSVRPVSRDWNLRQTPIVDAVKRVRAAVVNIHSERTVAMTPEQLFSTAPTQNRINGMGTGILIDPPGYITTNQHALNPSTPLPVPPSAPPPPTP